MNKRREITPIVKVVASFLSSIFSAKADKRYKPPMMTPPRRKPRGISICPLKKQNVEAKTANKVIAKLIIAVINEMECLSKKPFST